ncbi:hypothetical protein BSKO_04467 [Bryopsis sp. KO-2023]|nr:hypothetical protein BSKO_04467 [Bryopsis sp. KO-2023]
MGATQIYSVAVLHGKIRLGGVIDPPSPRAYPDFVLEASLPIAVFLVARRDAARDLPLVNIGRFYRTGKNDLWIPPFEERSTNRTIIHPDYVRTESDEQVNDIALLVLDQDSFFDPVELRSDECYQEGTCDSAVVAGWGRTVEGGRKSLSEALMKVTVPVFPLEDCRKLLFENQITEAMVCAGAEDKDSCQMDSGGPLLTGEPGSHSLLGVVSFGRGCGRADQPGVYASIPFLKGWIDGQLEEVSPPIVGPRPERPSFILVPPPEPKPAPEPEPEPVVDPQVARCFIFHGFWVPPGCNEWRREDQKRTVDDSEDDPIKEDEESSGAEQKEPEVMVQRGPQEISNVGKIDAAKKPPTPAQPTAEPPAEPTAEPKSTQPSEEPESTQPSEEPTEESTEELKPNVNPDEKDNTWDDEDDSTSKGTNSGSRKDELEAPKDENPEDGQGEETTTDKKTSSEQTLAPAVFEEEVVSRGRLTRQSSTAWGGESSRAVDGNFASEFSRGSCTHTGISDSINGQFSDYPWWSVDLGATRQVTRIRITNRADCCDFRLTGFEIRVGDLRPDGNGGQNALCREMLSVPRGVTSEFECRGEGRYLSIRIPYKSKILTLCEVEVIAKRKPVMNVDEFVLSRGQPTFQSSTKPTGAGAQNSICAGAQSVPGGATIVLECMGAGRYLSIRIPGNAKILTLCEVEVIGTGAL